MKVRIKKILPTNLFALVLLMWGVFIVNFLIPFIDLNNFGIRPRQSFGLVGVITSPFLHGNLAHIIANTFGLLVCGALLRVSYSKANFYKIIILGIFLSGLLTWTFSSSGVVIGASGLVFCFIGILLANAFFKPSILSWALAFMCLFFYSGAVLSLLSVQQGISWAGHFSGLASGVVMSFMLNKYPKWIL